MSNPIYFPREKVFSCWITGHCCIIDNEKTDEKPKKEL